MDYETQVLKNIREYGMSEYYKSILFIEKRMNILVMLLFIFLGVGFSVFIYKLFTAGNVTLCIFGIIFISQILLGVVICMINFITCYTNPYKIIAIFLENTDRR